MYAYSLNHTSLINLAFALFCFGFAVLSTPLLLYSTDSRRIDIANICFAFLNFSKTLDCFFELFLSAFLNF